MPVRLSDLPPELQRQVLAQLGGSPAKKTSQRPRTVKLRSTLMQRCVCGFEMFRPDGIYPKACYGCGRRWQIGKGK